MSLLIALPTPDAPALSVLLGGLFLLLGARLMHSRRLPARSR